MDTHTNEIENDSEKKEKELTVEQIAQQIQQDKKAREKQLRVDVQNITTAIKSNPYFVADVNLDGVFNEMVNCIQQVIKKKPNVCCMFISARDESKLSLVQSKLQVTMIAYIPTPCFSSGKHFTATEWVKSATKDLESCQYDITLPEKCAFVNSDGFASCQISKSNEMGSTAVLENMRAKCFQFLRDQKVLEEEEEEEFIGFDDI